MLDQVISPTAHSFCHPTNSVKALEGFRKLEQ